MTIKQRKTAEDRKIPPEVVSPIETQTVTKGRYSLAHQLPVLDQDQLSTTESEQLDRPLTGAERARKYRQGKGIEPRPPIQHGETSGVRRHERNPDKYGLLKDCAECRAHKRALNRGYYSARSSREATSTGNGLHGGQG